VLWGFFNNQVPPRSAQFQVVLIVASIFAGLEYVFVVLAEDRRWPISPLEPSCPKRLGRMTDYALVDFKKFDIEPYQPYKRGDSQQDFN